MALLSTLSTTLGHARDGIRRIGGLCLLFLGLHACADVLDDASAAVLDVLDLTVDEATAGFFAWLQQHGGLTPDAAARAIDRCATFIDLSEKEWLAVRIALLVELALDLAVLELAWGTRRIEGASAWEQLRDSARQLRDVLGTFDLARVLAPPALTVVVVGGALQAATALEQVARGTLERVVPDFLLAGNVAAALALLCAALLVGRFLPDLLHGAVVRAHEAGERERARIAARRAARDDEELRRGTRVRWPRLRGALHLLVDEGTRIRRGAWWSLVLALGLVGLLAHDVSALLTRLGAAP